MGDVHTENDTLEGKNFPIIWLDVNIDSDNNQQIMQELNYFNNNLNRFRDIRTCQKFIQEQSEKNNKLILIVSGTMGREIVPDIYKLPEIISIYVFCLDVEGNKPWTKKYSKIKAVLNNPKELISRIKCDSTSPKIDEKSSISDFITPLDQSTTGLGGKFVFFEIFMDCLLRLKPIEQECIELINRCKQAYSHESTTLQHIDEFQQTYSSNQVLKWYTKQTFFFDMLNSALRKEDLYMILLFRTHISDIQNQLKQHQTQNRITVYRGQFMSKSELDLLKRCRNTIIATKSFFSTSIDKKCALSFSVDPKRANLERVLFEIDADSNIVSSKPFADISKFSEHPNELETLFMFRSRFRLNEISYSKTDSHWIINMTWCNDDESNLMDVMKYMKQHFINGEINLRTVGNILRTMGEYDSAQTYFECLVNQLSADDSLRAIVYEELALLASHKKDYIKSLDYYQKLLEFNSSSASSNKIHTRATRKFTTPASILATLASTGTSNVTTSISYVSLQWNSTGTTLAANGSGSNQVFLANAVFIAAGSDVLYVADSNNNRIQKWLSNASSATTVAGGQGKGNNATQLNNPKAVYVDENENIFVADRGNYRVQVFSNGSLFGRTIISNGTTHTPNNLIGDLFGIGVDLVGNIYISEYNFNRILKLSPNATNATFVASNGTAGNPPTQLNSPTGFYVDRSTSTLYIANQNAHCIVKWSPSSLNSSTVAGTCGISGLNETLLNTPKWVTFDKYGNMYVVDGPNNSSRITMFYPNSIIGIPLVTRGLNSAQSIAVDTNLNLYVADINNNRIVKYELL